VSDDATRQSEPPAKNTPPKKDESVKETIISVIISFAMAFVFRSYVVEPFRIPTGSMAPTLLGAHMRFSSPIGGFDWTVNPRDYAAGNVPLSVQGLESADFDPVVVQDPMTGAAIRKSNVNLSAGDRILVLKYLYLLREPRRYEVVVFKNPENPAVNLIKRLVGLPGEEIVIIDGDVFARPAGAETPFAITRKPERVQREVWYPLFSSEFAPPTGSQAYSEEIGWRPPWAGEGWNVRGRAYRWDGSGDGVLRWDAAVRPINDFTPYNATLPNNHQARAYAYPMSDLRVRTRVRPDAAGTGATLTIEARGHVFQASLGAGGATISAAPIGGGEPLFAESVEGDFLPSERFTSVELWHVDQTLQLWVGGELVLSADYAWTPSERLRFGAAEGLERIEPADPETIAPPRVSMRFDGGPVTLTGTALDRDLYYRAIRQNGRYLRATHPTYPARLSPEQYFMLGDNSAASHDGRSWSRVNPWIGDRFDFDAGVVNEDLLLGKAFMVYWPAPYYAEIPPGISAPAPNVGQVRFIR
jgi:signal peptidase I